MTNQWPVPDDQDDPHYTDNPARQGLEDDLLEMHTPKQSKTGDMIGNVIGGLILGSLVCLVLAVIWRVIFILLGLAGE